MSPHAPGANKFALIPSNNNNFVTCMQLTFLSSQRSTYMHPTSLKIQKTDCSTWHLYFWVSVVSRLSVKLLSKPVFPLRKFYTEQMFVLVRMELRKHVNTQLVKRFKQWKVYAIYIRYGIWNVASARAWDFTAQMVWWYCAIAQLRTLEGTLI